MTYSPFVSHDWPKTSESEPLHYVEVNRRGELKYPQTQVVLKKAEREMGSRTHTRKIKLHPRCERDRQLLRDLFGTMRWTYNECVRICRDPAMRALRDATLNPTNGKPVS